MLTICELLWPNLQHVFPANSTASMHKDCHIFVSIPRDPRLQDTGRTHTAKITFQPHVLAAVWNAYGRSDQNLIDLVASQCANRIQARFEKWRTNYSGIHLTVYEI